MKNMLSLVILLSVLSMFPGCVKLQPQVDLTSVQGAEKMIGVDASSYKFTPNNIKVGQGDKIVFSIANVSDKVHNFTIKDPKGKKIQEVDLPAKKTIPVTVTFAEPGKYEFYCDKPFHSTFGMKGEVEVTARPQ